MERKHESTPELPSKDHQVNVLLELTQSRKYSKLAWVEFQDTRTKPSKAVRFQQQKQKQPTLSICKQEKLLKTSSLLVL